jgi:hypothetical protein
MAAITWRWISKWADFAALYEYGRAWAVVGFGIPELHMYTLNLTALQMVSAHSPQFMFVSVRSFVTFLDPGMLLMTVRILCTPVHTAIDSNCYCLYCFNIARV